MPTIAATATVRNALFDRNGRCIVILFGSGYGGVSEWGAGIGEITAFAETERRFDPNPLARFQRTDAVVLAAPAGAPR
jgi:hypothetical protein